MISAIVLTKNEQENISPCLLGLKWADEILVIDDDSTDKTREIAQKNGARVIVRAIKGDFAAQRNFALRQAQGDWVLFVDADERVSEELKEEILCELKKADRERVVGFYLPRIDFFINRWLKHTERVKLLRLAKKGAGTFKRRVDEYWEVKGRLKKLNSPLHHYSHPHLDQFLATINARTSLNALVFYEENQRLSMGEWLKPGAKFIVSYFFRGGFLDGTAGFVFAVLMSLHSYLVRGKLYLLWKKGSL